MQVTTNEPEKEAADQPADAGDEMSMNSSQLQETTLLAYRGTSGMVKAALTLLIPFGIVIVFLAISLSGDEFALDTAIEMSTLLRVVLIAHGLYFIVLPFNFELMLETSSTKNYFGKIPPRPDNLYWMFSCLAGELFFVSAVAYFLMASQDYVPRWTMFIPIAQCAYNMKNDLIWVFLGNSLSPIKKRISIMILDFLFVFPCFVVYIICFFTL